MKNLKFFGAPIYDTVLVFIIISTLCSIGFNFFGEIGRSEANICLLVAAVISALYYFKVYKQ